MALHPNFDTRDDCSKRVHRPGANRVQRMRLFPINLWGRIAECTRTGCTDTSAWRSFTRCGCIPRFFPGNPIGKSRIRCTRFAPTNCTHFEQSSLVSKLGCRAKPKQSEPISNQRWVRIVFAWNACAESGNSSIYMRLSNGEGKGEHSPASQNMGVKLTASALLNVL